jgi:hypothetical protein
MDLALVLDLPAGDEGRAVMARLGGMALRGEASLVLSGRDTASGSHVVVVRLVGAAVAAALTTWLAARPGGTGIRTLLPDGEAQAGLGVLFP